MDAAQGVVGRLWRSLKWVECHGEPVRHAANVPNDRLRRSRRIEPEAIARCACRYRAGRPSSRGREVLIEADCLGDPGRPNGRLGADAPLVLMPDRRSRPTMRRAL